MGNYPEHLIEMINEDAGESIYDETLDNMIAEDFKTIQFFMPIIPPTKTHQMKKIRIVSGKPIFYEPDELKAVRTKLQAHLGQHIPAVKYTGAIRLITKWCYPKGKHKDGQWKTTKPDTDNMIKMLKDVMTDLGFWTDDSLVASEITEKFWADIPGIYVSIEDL